MRFIVKMLKIDHRTFNKDDLLQNILLTDILLFSLC